MKVLIILISISIVSISLQDSCTSPLDCYTKAYQIVNKAKLSYETAMNNIKVVQEELKERLKQFTNETQVSTNKMIDNSKVELSNQINENSYLINSSIIKVKDFSTKFESQINTARKQIEDIISTEITISNEFRYVYFVTVTGQCLTYNGKGDSIFQSPCDINSRWTPNQAWKIYSDPEGWYSISTPTDLFIDNYGNDMKNNNKIQAWERNLLSAQRWNIAQYGPTKYVIILWNTNKCIDINPSAKESRLWDWNETANQLYEIKAVGY